MKLHPNEFPIDEHLVANLVKDQMPEWAELSIARLTTTGTVNLAFRLGEEMLIRLPRTPEYREGPRHESRWLPVFGPALPLEIPAHLALGRPTERYPSHWSVLSWIEGTNADRRTVTDLESAASSLGEFVMALRATPADDAPEDSHYRGLGLGGVYDSFHHWLDQMPDDDFDRRHISNIWEQCSSADSWNGPPKWFHGDLQPGNLIARDGELTAVIDWEGCSVGDPSSDLLAAWWLFEGNSRETFRSITRASRAEWLRAKGWALFMAVAAIPYYSETNPGFASRARSALAEILRDG